MLGGVSARCDRPCTLMLACRWTVDLTDARLWPGVENLLTPGQSDWAQVGVAGGNQGAQAWGPNSRLAHTRTLARRLWHVISVSQQRAMSW